MVSSVKPGSNLVVSEHCGRGVVVSSTKPESNLVGTSTSPSGRHLGHYKSIVQDADLLSVQVKMMNIAIKNGIALD